MMILKTEERTIKDNYLLSLLNGEIYMNNLEFQNSLDRIKGLTVAIVYIFEGEQAAGFAHYHIWKGDIISKWLNAIANVGCRPFILDVRTFVEKAFSNTLPHIDFVINLNCGSTDLDPMAIVPSTCAFLGIPCIPCGSFSILAGENKYHSNLLAKECGLLVSPTCEASDPNGIFRPLNWGSSLGVVRGKCPTAQKGIYQKFIKGFDITTPAIFNPLTENFDFLPTIVYVPKNQDINWFFGETAKEEKIGYQRELVYDLCDSLKEKYIELIRIIGVKTFCRIDARIMVSNYNDIDAVLSSPISDRNLYFVEINVMPTINTNNSFGFSYAGFRDSPSQAKLLRLLDSNYPQMDVHTFVLATALLAYYI